MLMKRGPDRGYFPELAKSLFISDTLGQEEATKRDFATEGLVLNLVSGSIYLWGLSWKAEGVRGMDKTPSGGMGPQV